MVSSHSLTFHAVLLQSPLSSLPDSCYLFGDTVIVSGFGSSTVSEEVAEHESQTPHKMILHTSAFSHLLAAKAELQRKGCDLSCQCFSLEVLSSNYFVQQLTELLPLELLLILLY